MRGKRCRRYNEVEVYPCVYLFAWVRCACHCRSVGFFLMRCESGSVSSFPLMCVHGLTRAGLELSPPCVGWTLDPGPWSLDPCVDWTLDPSRTEALVS